MSASMPVDGPEHEIFLRALRDYSEQCEPPALTLGCPFRRVDARAGVWCLDECLDLLALHQPPLPAGASVIGDFRLVRSPRPRARRGLGGSKQPFDSREIFLADQKLSVERRRTVALIHGLASSLNRMPDAARDLSDSEGGEPQPLMAELERRGFDVELLVREGLGPEITGGILGSVLIRRVISDGGLDIELPPEGAWDALLVTGAVETPAQLVASVARRGLDIERWVSSADLADVVALRAPTPEEFASLPLKDPAHRDHHRWLCDRFLRTYLADWSTESLKAEWTYQHGELMPPCPAQEMHARTVDESDLARHLADRVVRDQHTTRTSLARFVPIAVDLLRDGKRSAAVAIFEAVAQAEPEHAEAQNNFGFCLLPDDPQRALTALQRAADLGYASAPFNIGNRVQALALIGRLTPALELAERFADMTAPLLGPTYGWMWEVDFSTKEPTLVEVTDVRAHVFRSALLVARMAGDEKLVQGWQARVDGLEGAHQA